MKRALWIGGGILGVLVIAVVAVSIYVLSSLDSLVQTAIETYGSQATQSEVTVGGVDIDLTSGEGAVSGLQVGNPPGFATPTALMLGQIAVQVDTATVTEDPIVISSIAIDSPSVTYEVGQQESNIDALQRNVEQFAGGAKSDSDGTKGGDDKAESAAPAAGGEQQDAGPKLIIDNLYVRNGTVNVSATVLEGQQLSAPLTDIHLTGIGRDSGGASAEQVAEEVLSVILAEASNAAGSIGVGKTLDDLQKQLGDPAGAGGDAAKDVGEGLKKLLD